MLLFINKQQQRPKKTRRSRSRVCPLIAKSNQAAKRGREREGEGRRGERESNCSAKREGISSKHYISRIQIHTHSGTHTYWHIPSLSLSLTHSHILTPSLTLTHALTLAHALAHLTLFRFAFSIFEVHCAPAGAFHCPLAQFKYQRCMAELA